MLNDSFRTTDERRMHGSMKTILEHLLVRPLPPLAATNGAKYTIRHFRNYRGEPGVCTVCLCGVIVSSLFCCRHLVAET